jgi:glutaredoxin-like protein DUF836
MLRSPVARAGWLRALVAGPRLVAGAADHLDERGLHAVAHMVMLYAKAGCHLCDEARAYLEDALADLDLAPGAIELAELDIRRDDDLFERYRYRIPVITVDGVERLEGRIEACAVRELLRSLP